MNSGILHHVVTSTEAESADVTRLMHAVFEKGTASGTDLVGVITVTAHCDQGI